MQFKYCKNPSAKVPILVIDKHIGNSTELGQGIDGGQFLNEVFELKNNYGATEVDVLINTPGGSMVESSNIRGACELAGLVMNTLNYGLAASSGGTIWLKGKYVKMTPSAIFMCHDPMGGNEDENSSEQRAFTISAATMISEGSGRNGHPKITVDEAMEMMKKTTFLNADECYEMGLCNEVIPDGDFREQYRTVDAMDFFTAGNNILNSLLHKNNTMVNENNLLLITNELELTEDAGSREITKSIKALRNKANSADELIKKVNVLETTVADLTKVKNEMEDKAEAKDTEHADMVNKLTTMKNECDNLQKKVDEYDNKMKEKEKEDAEKEAKRNETDCVNMVNSYATKIGGDADVIGFYVETAKTQGLDKVKNMLEKLPVFKAGTKVSDITTKVNTAAAETGKSENMADVMARANAKRMAKK